MSVAIAHILDEVMRLPSDSRTELVEAILERSTPTAEFVDHQLEVVARRMENVRAGASRLIPASEAHEQVLKSLRTRE